MSETEPPHVRVDVAPYSTMQVYAPEADQDLLLFLERNWTVLWAAAKPRLEEMCAFYEVSEHLKEPEWVGAIQRLEPDVFMADKAEFLFSIGLGDTQPEWDFFLKGVTIAHSQPVD